MDSNPTASTGQPPSHGHRAYAEMIKQYLIYGRFYAGWTKNQGRYTFSVMHTEPTDGSYRGEPMGFQMTDRNTTGHPVNDTWVLRIYQDGTALFRAWKLGYMRYPTQRTIISMVEYFYYKESAIGQGYQATTLLRRRPLNPNYIVPSTGNFGDFLANKYNH